MVLHPSYRLQYDMAVLTRGGTAVSPEIWLALAVIFGISVRDLRMVLHLVFLASDRWIKESARGLEIFRPTNKA